MKLRLLRLVAADPEPASSNPIQLDRSALCAVHGVSAALLNQPQARVRSRNVFCEYAGCEAVGRRVTMSCTAGSVQDLGCPHDLLCSTLRAYVVDRDAGEADECWCPYAAAHRGALERAGITLPRADGTFDPAAIAASKDACTAGACESPRVTLGEIIAWRIWVICGGYLLSPLQQVRWPPEGLMSGNPGSGFGVFAFKQRRQAVEEAKRMSTQWLPVAYGSVRMWGEVVEHSRGYRAEFARIATVDGAYPSDQQLAAVSRKYSFGAAT